MVGDVEVRAGDWVVADRDGVVIVPGGSIDRGRRGRVGPRREGGRHVRRAAGWLDDRRAPRPRHVDHRAPGRLTGRRTMRRLARWCAPPVVVAVALAAGCLRRDVVGRRGRRRRAHTASRRAHLARDDAATTTITTAAARCAEHADARPAGRAARDGAGRDPAAASDAVASGLVGGYALQGDQGADFATPGRVGRRPPPGRGAAVRGVRRGGRLGPAAAHGPRSLSRPVDHRGAGHPRAGGRRVRGLRPASRSARRQHDPRTGARRRQRSRSGVAQLRRRRRDRRPIRPSGRRRDRTGRAHLGGEALARARVTARAIPTSGPRGSRRSPTSASATSCPSSRSSEPESAG